MLYLTDSSGQFTYWSQRTRARPFNKGLRLDYFVCSKEMFTDEQLQGNVLKSEACDGLLENAECSSGIENVEGSEEPEQSDGMTACSKSDKKVKTRLKRAAPGALPAPAVTVAVEVKADAATVASDKIYSNPRNVKVVDSYILQDENDCSDHCPVVLILQVTPSA